jgi:P pilus assembly chaperone PapD
MRINPNTMGYSFAISLILLFAPSVHAGVMLNRAIVIFDDSDQARQDVIVSNDSDSDRLFVSVTPFLVMNPGTEERELAPLSIDEDAGLLVTPNKLLIEPSGSAIVRMLNMAEPDINEVYYRINFTPIQKPIEFERQEGEELEQSQMLVSIALAYQALVIVPPLEPKALPRFTRTGKTVVFTNPGNSFYLLRDGVQCSPDDPDDCVDLTSKRVYPGNEYVVELPFDGPAQYVARVFDGSKVISVP